MAPAKGPIVVGQFDDPLQFLMAVMNDSTEEIDVRKDAAKAMLPYIHPKKGETGKKRCPKCCSKSSCWQRQVWSNGTAKTRR